jgi:hypothetical protein
MNKFSAIFIVFAFLALLFLSTRLGRTESSTELVGNITIGIALYLIMIGYVGFALFHAIQRLNSPEDRTKWTLLILFFTVFGACAYYCTTYQKLKRAGQGRLITFKKKDNKAEQDAAANP